MQIHILANLLILAGIVRITSILIVYSMVWIKYGCHMEKYIGKVWLILLAYIYTITDNFMGTGVLVGSPLLPPRPLFNAVLGAVHWLGGNTNFDVISPQYVNIEQGAWGRGKCDLYMQILLILCTLNTPCFVPNNIFVNDCSYHRHQCK